MVYGVLHLQHKATILPPKLLFTYNGLPYFQHQAIISMLLDKRLSDNITKFRLCFVTIYSLIMLNMCASLNGLGKKESNTSSGLKKQSFHFDGKIS